MVRGPSRTTWAPSWLLTEPIPAPPAEQGPPAERASQASGSVPPWDQAEADRLLTELRDGLARIERKRYRGKFPPHLATVTTSGLAVCEGYVANHATEAARGWDALELLRDGVRSLLRIARGEPRKQAEVFPPWVREGRGSC
jgi:hypothetical protein